MPSAACCFIQGLSLIHIFLEKLVLVLSKEQEAGRLPFPLFDGGEGLKLSLIHIFIIYTLEGFQRHPEIDAIEVVCLDGWHDILKAYARQFNIDKLKWVVSGGKTGQESIRNGVYHLEGILNEDDIVVIHDGIRPLVDDTVLSDVMIKCRQYGNGVTSMPYNEQIFRIKDEISTCEYIPRETLRRVATPQAYRFGKLDWAYHERCV